MTVFCNNLTSSSHDWERMTNHIMFYINQGLGLIFTILCLFWLVYVIIELIRRIRIKQRLLTIIQFGTNYDYTNVLFIQRESIFRNVIFLIFLIFEMMYCLSIHILSFVNFKNIIENGVFDDINCSLHSNPTIWASYDSKFSYFVGVVLMDDFSFSMMIWLFGSSLLHLSFAARNQLKVKKVICFICMGLVFNFLFVIPIAIPYINLFGKLFQSLMNQISFFVVIYIAKKKFFPAMNSRVIDAFHLFGTDQYLKQKKLLMVYQRLVCFFSFTFELFILKDLIFNNFLIISKVVSAPPCWIFTTYHLHIFTISEYKRHILTETVFYCWIIVEIINFVMYTSLILVNLNFIIIIAKKYYKERFRKSITYRYKIFSAPLLSDYN